MTRLFIVLLILFAIVLAACDTPTATDAATVSPPAASPTSEIVITAAQPSDTDTPPSDSQLNIEGIVRDAVSEADRANAERVAAADLPIGDLRELAIRLLGLPADTPRSTCTTAADFAVGDEEVFQVSNSDTFEQFEVTATLLAREPNVYMWVENQAISFVDADAIRSAARILDQEIIPRNRELFGIEWSPGIDCDPHLHILHTTNTATAGYFSSVDQYITAVRADSNEKEIFYIDLFGIGGPEQVGSSFYMGVLAHEYQHMIHFFIDRNEVTWANEGLSELAMFLNDFDIGGSDLSFANTPNTQLNFWPEGGGAGVNYGAAFTFWLYFYDRYGEQGITEIVANQRNGLDGVAGALQEVGYDGTLDDFFADWVVAKYVDDPSLQDGRYGFAQTDPPQARPSDTIDSFPSQYDEARFVRQYAARYTRLIGDNDIQIEFIGQTKARLIDADPHSGEFYWWSNRGDSADMRLTREVDLTGVSSATLNYWTWYDIEADWDYAYVVVSDDGGTSWDIIETPSGTDRDPNLNNFGWGYTGNSGGQAEPIWIEESVDLTPYAGKTILLRFEKVHDLAVNLPGFALDDIEIPEIGFVDDAESDTGWIAEGWIRTNNFVPQKFIAQLIGFDKDGNTIVTRLPINDDNTAVWHIPLSELNSATIALTATAVKTSEPALFNWVVTELLNDG